MVDAPDDRLHEQLQRARTDDAELAQLIAGYLPSLRAFVRARLRPELRAKESASDVVQSVCRELLGDQEAFEFRGAAAFRSWLFTAALNKIRDRDRFYRQDKRDRDRETPAAEEQLLAGYASVCTPSQVVAGAEQVAILERAMDELEPDHREVIAYARLAGLPAKEIAPLMGRTEAAVYALLGRGLIKLAEKLQQHGLRPPGETL